MAETTAIEWTDATVNWWWGCTKVGAGCDHCYAETWNNLRGTGEWGAGAPRRKIKGAPAMLAKLHRQANVFERIHHRPRRVFMQSMSDSFDNEIDPAWREEMFTAIEASDRLSIQLLTKRVSNVPKMVPSHWERGHWPQHVGLMITVVNQEEANRDIPRLLNYAHRFGIPWIGLSIEPLLGPINVERWLHESDCDPTLTSIDGLCMCADRRKHHPDIPVEITVDWVITGGETGPKARSSSAVWYRSLADQCARTGAAFFFKHWGEWIDADNLAGTHSLAVLREGLRIENVSLNFAHAESIAHSLNKPVEFHSDGSSSIRVGKAKSGNKLNGQTFKEFPAALMEDTRVAAWNL